MAMNLTMFASSCDDSDDVISDTYNNCTENVTSGIGGIISMTTARRPGMFFNLMELAVILLRCYSAVVAVIAVLFNSLTFAASRKACPENLKSKHLIQNAILADIALALGCTLPVVRYILEAYHVSAFLVVQELGNFVLVMTIYGQLFATALLACDRMYAVARPLAYHTVGYNKLSKILLVTLSWTVAVVLVIPGLITAFVEDHFVGAPLHVQLNYGFRHYVGKFRDYITIGVNVAIFLLYALIFVVLDRQRRSNQALGKSSSADSAKTSALSLTLTYFLIHVSSLCLYLPGPVFKAIRNDIPTDVMSNNVKSIINRTFVNLYIFNAVLDPIILGLRVRSIRGHLKPILNPIQKQTKRRGIHGTNSTKLAA